jgi:hypothetical protein
MAPERSSKSSGAIKQKVDNLTMTRIAKKAGSVKRRTAAKPVKLPSPRYTIRKDSLERRYAVDKRTGQRVSLYKAEKEREQRRKAAKLAKAIPQHKAPKAAKTRSLAAKKGWQTRRAKAIARSDAAKKGWATRRRAIGPAPVELVPISFLTPPERLPPPLPPGILLPLHEDIRDRMARYPKVKEAVEDAFTRLQIEAWNKRGDRLAGKPIPHKMTREERIEGNIRDLIAERITDPGDIDRVLEQLYIELDEEFTMRELYTLYFSPDVA